jgi:hypothetical protein
MPNAKDALPDDDWLNDFHKKQTNDEMEARGGTFEGLVDAVQSALGGNRDLVRLRLHRTLEDFENCSEFYRTVKSANPRKWLKRVNAAVLLDDAIAWEPSTSAELADLRNLFGAQPLLRLADDVQRLVNVTNRGFPRGKPGRRSPTARRDLVADLATMFKEYKGDWPGLSRTGNKPGGPFFRIVKAAFTAVGETRKEEAIAKDIIKAIAKRKATMGQTQSEKDHK